MAALWGAIALVSVAMAGTTRIPQGVERVVPPTPRNGFIHDGGPILAAGDLARLNDRIATLQASGRGDIGVAILKDLRDYPPFEVGTAIYRAWKIGSVDTIGSDRRNLGLLLLIVPKELAPNGRGECWITTGVGAEGIVTDAIAARICRDSIIPHLRDKDYAGAVNTGITAMEEALIRAVAPFPSEVAPGPGEPIPLVDQSRPSGRSIFPIVGSIALGLGGLGAGAVAWRVRKRRRPRRCPNGHGPMRRLDEKADDASLVAGQLMEEKLDSVDYDVWHCDICGEETILQYKGWLTSYSKCESCAFWTVKSKTRTLVRATTSSGGLQEVTKTCKHCGWTKTTRHSTPRVSTSSSSSSGGSSSSRSFGGSGRSSGGGGGSSY